MSLPAERRISHGRTHPQAWDALRYASPLERPAPIGIRGPITAVIVGLALLLAVVLVAHLIGRLA